MPRVSVIIPAYNSARYLLDAIDSVFAQTYKDLEVIVIDDGSTDNTKEILEPYMDRIIFLQQANSGPSKARNLGIQRSSGEYLAFLDADDIWYPEKMERQIGMFLENPQYMLVHSNALVKAEDNSQPDKFWFDSKKRVKSGKVFSDLLAECFIILSSVIIKRQCLDKTGIFDTNVEPWEGYDLWLRFAYSYQIGFISNPLFVRRLHSSNLFYSNLSREILGYIKIMEKWEVQTKFLSEGFKVIIHNHLKKEYHRLGICYLAQCEPYKARTAFKNSLRHGYSLSSITYLGLSVLPPTVLKCIRDGKRRFISKTNKIERI
jgi:glycosyltransferase involved in cell wall biosynthesis